MTEIDQIKKDFSDLADSLRKRAYDAVPEDWAGRGLHHKYLKCDHHAAGLDDAAWEIDGLLAEKAHE